MMLFNELKSSAELKMEPPPVGLAVPRQDVVCAVAVVESDEPEGLNRKTGTEAERPLHVEEVRSLEVLIDIAGLRALDSPAEMTDNRAELVSAPRIGFAPPPTTTVMNATSTKVVPMSGTMVVVGA